MTIRIALADDQALVREGLKALLLPLGIATVLEASNGALLLDLLQQQRGAVEVILSDIRMPNLDGLALTRALRELGDPTPIVLLTTFDDEQLLPQAVAAGAQGFLMKDASPEDLRDAIVRAQRGEAWLAPVATAPVRERFAYHERTEPHGSFNEREVSILRLMAGGYSNKEIARSLYLAEGTVKNYVSEILEKLGTRDRTRAVLKAITLQIV
jgi:DNA-binding NarL/FixJ family response regulator